MPTPVLVLRRGSRVKEYFERLRQIGSEHGSPEEIETACKLTLLVGVGR